MGPLKFGYWIVNDLPYEKRPEILNLRRDMIQVYNILHSDPNQTLFKTKKGEKEAIAINFAKNTAEEKFTL